MGESPAPPSWTAGLKAIQDRRVGFAKENAERSVLASAELARAKDVQEVLTLQSRYAQTQMQFVRASRRSSSPG